MENNKKNYSTEDLSLHNNTNLVDHLTEEQNIVKEDSYKVNFHSDLINEIIGDLDITV